MLTIIGCGNLNRSDDGVGVVVAQRLQAWLQERPVEGVRVFDAGTGGMEVMFQAKGASALIIVDACVSGSEPGAVFEVPGEELARKPAPSFNLHDFRWDDALYAGQRIFGDTFPDDIGVVLIEAASTDFGLDLSPAVEAAAAAVEARLKARIEAWAKPVPAPIPTDAGD
ncbi:MAG: hydrogenase maturation protease [Alphaproteobacteria bacterium]